MALRPFQTTTWVNDLGQSINEGDFVVGIAQGYSHSIREFTGVFVGHRNGTPIVKANQRRYDRKTGKYVMSTRITNLPARRVYPSEAPPHKVK